MASPSHSTNTLLIRLRQNGGDEEAWKQFVDRYAARFYRWCRNRGVQDADAADVTQEVFCRVVKGIRTFNQQSGSARSWLFKILRNCLSDGLSNGRSALGGEAARNLLESRAAVADLEQRLAEEFDLERREVAEKNVQARLRGEATWEAYALTCRDGLADDVVATRLGIPRPHVIRYRSRVLAMVTEEVRRLADLEDGRQAP
jgi:RNA polymerase sigma-70 factor (ECF subfamily)